MSDGRILHGYGPSVYCRMVRIVLAETGLAADWRAVDPFADDPAGSHPMGRVPVLDAGGTRLFETGAITRYLDRVSGGRLTPRDTIAAARMDQVIGIVDSYAYIPLVRQVYAHAVFRPRMGEVGDPAQVATGLTAAVPVLAMLEEIAAEGAVLSGTRTLADCHLAPILAAFAEAEAGAALMSRHPAIGVWLRGLEGWAAFTSTETLPLG